MEFSQEFWAQVILQFIFLAFFAGVIWTKLGYIEKKQDKHNGLIERMYNVEQKTDEIKSKIKNIQEKID